jgi:hypothetical protein
VVINKRSCVATQHNVFKMAKIIQFPVPEKEKKSDLESVIDKALSKVPAKDRERLKFELVKTIDSYDAFFTTWSLSVPKDASEEFLKQIYDIARQEHERKMLMLAEIIRLKIRVLVDEYERRG